MAAGSVYAACRCGGYTRTVDEIAVVARVPAEKIRLGYSICNQELGLPAAVTTPSTFVPQLASDCDLGADVERRAMALAKTAQEQGIANGPNPRGVAAACCYLAGEELDVYLTQEEVGEHADVSPVTVRARYYELLDAVE